MEFPSEYPFVLLAALGMSWQAFAFAAQISKFRRQVFNKDFMQDEFRTMHKRELNADIQVGGLPDTGSGVYSQRLSYRY